MKQKFLQIFSLLAVMLMVGVSSAYSYNTDAGTFTIDFYNEEKLSSTNGTGIQSNNYDQFVNVPSGLDANTVVTNCSATGTVAFGKNGGLTFGTSSTSAKGTHSVTFTIGSGYIVNKVTVYAAKYDAGYIFLNDKKSDSGSLADKGTKLANVTTPLVWDNLNGITTLKFDQAGSEDGTSTCKRTTIYKIVCEYGTVVPKTPQTVSFTNPTTSVNIGSTVTNVATSTGTGTITYSSSNTDVATVNATTGEVTGVADGTAIITATAAENETYSSGTNSYKISVNDPKYTKFTYDFHSSASAYPVGFPTVNGTVATAEEFTISGNTIVINAVNGYYEMNSEDDNARAFFFGKSSTSFDETSYLEFPAKSGYKLSKVVATTSSSVAGGVDVNIYKANGFAISTAKTTSSGLSEDLSFILNNPEDNTAYRLASLANGKNLQFFSIVLAYEQCEVDNREVPTASFDKNAYFLVKNDDVTITVTTNSDGAVTYSSSDDNIAMVDETTGEVLAIDAGKAIITATIAGTATYKPAEVSYNVLVTANALAGDGTKENPFTVEDVITMDNVISGNYWVVGKATGYYKNSSYNPGTENAEGSNIAFEDLDDNKLHIPVQLGTDAMKKISLVQQPTFLNKTYYIYGSLETYFSTTGVKSTSKYVVKDAVSVTPAKQYITYCNALPLDYTGIDAYYVSECSATTATLVAVSAPVAAGTGVILNGTPSTEYKFDANSETTAITNKLVGVTAAKDDMTAGDYILSDGKFVPCTAGTLAANKAYLPASAVSSGAKDLFFVFDDATAIDKVDVNCQQSTVNGIYNLAGQKVGADYKGIVIVNGKKYLNK